MDSEYCDYLQSDAWKAKRLRRLAISKFRCSVCPENKAIHVHHLTYARIFNEDMADLMPLCELHHRAAEELIRKGKLSRTGDVLFLASETIRLIVPRPKEKKLERKQRKQRDGRKTPKCYQDDLMNDRWFLALLQRCLPNNRRQFKLAVNQEFRKHPEGARLKANSFTLFDRFRKK